MQLAPWELIQDLDCSRSPSSQLLQNEDNRKKENNLKIEDGLKNEDNLENWPSHQNSFWPPLIPLKNYLKYFLMTSHHDSHTTTDVKLEMIPGF